ncbi:uncharacterized protein LOC127130740 [Lathyrus oleraceus]|uniref:uncharacterized protein LOC127130740 n=1 Tax=Pisum sativum TaxID=3888 RepID=UPI0021D20874|nr:uncharacterized protein LOC127130740 [Pisum sativum]
MALTSFDITWANVMHVTEMITSCGEFFNVPLMGTKGCINYNHVLAIRQLGFALRDEPKAREIEASVCFAKKENPELLHLGGKSVRRLQAENYKTQAKKDEMGMQLYQVDQERRQLMHKLKEAKRSVPTKRQRPENSRAFEHRNKEIKELNRELFKAQQTNLKLEASKAKSKVKHKKELKILEKKLQDEQKEAGRVKGEKKRLEFNLKERQKYLDKALEEKKKLKEEKEILVKIVIGTTSYAESSSTWREIANSSFHLYSTRANEQRKMERIQADMAAMQERVTAQMRPFMELMQNMAIRQEELRAIVLRPIEGNPFGEDDNENNGNPHPPILLRLTRPHLDMMGILHLLCRLLLLRHLRMLGMSVLEFQLSKCWLILGGP